MSEELDDWVATVCEELGIAGAVDPAVARDLVLDLARDVAHGVERPAAPLTTFLLGLAAGRAEDPRAALAATAGTIRALVERHRRDED